MKLYRVGQLVLPVYFILVTEDKGCVDWMHLVQGRNQWQARVNTVMELQVP